MLGPSEHLVASCVPAAGIIGEIGTGPFCAGDLKTPRCGDSQNPLVTGDMYSGLTHSDRRGSSPTPPAFGNLPTIPARSFGLTRTLGPGRPELPQDVGQIGNPLPGTLPMPSAVGDIYAGLWAGQMYAGLRWRLGEMGTTFAGDTGTTGFGEMETTLFIGDMYAGYVMVGAGPVRSCGVMETTVTGDVPVTPVSGFGEIPVGPVRSSGDIYATGAVGNTGDAQTVPAFGDIYCGVWAGDMLTGVKRQPGDTETTLTADRNITEFGEPGMPPVIGQTSVDAPGTFGEIPITPAGSCGDMYGGVWAGLMAGGPSAAFGHMETT